MTLSWYDVLDVDETATEAEIRAAWKASIADLDPTDRRLRVLNQAAGVLLDPAARAAHDADLSAQGSSEEATVTAEPNDAVAEPSQAVSLTKASAVDDPDPDPNPDSYGDSEDAPATTSSPSRSRLLRRVCVALGVVALVLVVLTVVAFVRTDGDDDGTQAGSGSNGDSSTGTEEQVAAARAAAEVAVVPVLSYDYRTLAEDSAAARSYMTPSYQAKYEQYFAAAVETNAPRTRTVVDVQLVASGVVRTGTDRVDVLLFVDRPTTNRQLDEPVIYKDQVTLRMREIEGDWLVDDLVTTSPLPQ